MSPSSMLLAFQSISMTIKDASSLSPFVRRQPFVIKVAPGCFRAKDIKQQPESCFCVCYITGNLFVSTLSSLLWFLSEKTPILDVH